MRMIDFVSALVGLALWFAISPVAIGADSTTTTEAVTTADASTTSEVTTTASDAASTTQSSTATEAVPVPEIVDERPNEPWDYSPYRVLVWIDSDDSTINTDSLSEPVHEFLDRQFSSVWRITIESAPSSVSSVSRRSLADLKYEMIAAADPVLAVKRTHQDAARIRFVSDFPQYVKKVLSTSSRTAEILQRIPENGDKTLSGLVPLISNIDGDALNLRQLWADEQTEAMLMSRGMAMTLKDPEAKIITPPITGLVAESASLYDKIFVVSITTSATPMRVRAVEFDTLQQVFGPVVEGVAMNKESLVSTIGTSMIKAFAPIVRIENAGDKNADGMLRAGGLILDKNSPALIRVGDVLIPMVRKDDRNGKPITIGPIPWAFLLVVEKEVTAFGMQSVPGVQTGDRIVRIDGLPASDAHVIDKALRNSASENIAVELIRDDKPVELNLARSQVAALVPQYLGFEAVDKGSGEKRQLIVTAVRKDSAADGQLRVGDAILAVGNTKGLDAASLRQLVITAEPEQAIEFSVGRGDATETVSIVPSEISDYERRQSFLLDMDFHAGRAGGLQGRNNKRTFRTALKSRPFYDQTVLRMHVRGAVKEPLIGYEIYEKELNSKDMTFLGRTDWNGRLWLEKTENPLRLLYVKNGGAVLARLPVVPGQTELEVADMTGDDLRLQAEAYIRGVQNAIVDLIAIRELFAARVRLRLRKGEMKEGEDLLNSLREQPTNEKIAEDMGKKQTMFLKLLGSGNANQRKMIDQMFSTTRELLSKHINPKLIRDLEADYLAAKNNGGKLPDPDPEEAANAKPQAVPPPPVDEPAGDQPAAAQPPAAAP